MTDTTIPVDSDVKNRLSQLKREKETWNGLFVRLVESHDEYVTALEAREIADEQITSRVVSEAQEGL